MKVPESTDISVVGELEKAGLERFRETGMLTIHTHFSSQLISTIFHLFIPHLHCPQSAHTCLLCPASLLCPQVPLIIINCFQPSSIWCQGCSSFPWPQPISVSSLHSIRLSQSFSVYLTKKSNQINKTDILPQCSSTFAH